MCHFTNLSYIRGLPIMFRDKTGKLISSAKYKREPNSETSMWVSGQTHYVSSADSPMLFSRSQLGNTKFPMAKKIIYLYLSHNPRSVIYWDLCFQLVIHR